MHFSNDQELMYERLQDGNSFLYKKEPIGEGPNLRVRWNKEYRFSQFP